MLLSYKPLHLEAQQRLQEEGCVVDITSLRGTPTEEEEVRKSEEALALEAVERSLELEQLETRERQVAQAEDAAGAHEAKV